MIGNLYLGSWDLQKVSRVLTCHDDVINWLCHQERLINGGVMWHTENADLASRLRCKWLLVQTASYYTIHWLVKIIEEEHTLSISKRTIF
jgi:hypothetical protein